MRIKTDQDGPVIVYVTVVELHVLLVEPSLEWSGTC
jgi:hypothetical protein